MAYLFESLSLFSLVTDPEKVELTALIMFWSKYSGLSAILALVLMSSISVDQLTLIQGKFKTKHQNDYGTNNMLFRQPIIQFLKYHFFGSTKQDRIYLRGANEIGQLRFLVYNLTSTLIWISVIVMAGIALRYAWTNLFGNFGPLEVEIISGILTVYISGLLIIIISKFIRNSRERSPKES